MRRKIAALVLWLLLGLAVGPARADYGGNPPDSINPEARSLYDQAAEHFRKKQWNLAIPTYLEAVRIEPKFVEAWNSLGFCYRKVKDNQKSLEAYRRAIDIKPDFKYAHEYISRLYLVMGNREMAMRHYEILRRLDAKMAADLLRAIEANNPDLGED
jgi:tetratricopeptide (TPR) repeat protein